MWIVAMHWFWNCFQVPWAYYGCWDLVIEVFTLKTRFLHFWTDECSLKRAKRREDSYVRSRVRLSELASELFA